MRSTPMYKRIRVVAAWYLVQTVAILSVFGAVFGNLALLLALGAGVGLATALSMVAAWHIGRKSLEDAGFRW